MSLLISTVSSGSRNRLAPLADAAVDDARNRGAMLGAHHQHVAAVAVGDHLLLQVLRVSRPRRNDSSVVRRRCFCLRSRSRMLASAGLALSATSPDGSILRRTSAISLLNDATVSTSARRIGNAAPTFVTALPRSARSTRDSPASPSSRSGSSARPSTPSASRISSEIRRRPQREARMVGQEARALGRGPLRRDDLRRGRSADASSASRSRPGRRDGQAGDDRHDAIELEGPQRAGIHERFRRPRCTDPNGNRLFAASGVRSKVIDPRRHAGGAEAVVDVHHRHAVRAAVEHPEQRGDAAEAGAVADARRHGDHRHVDQPGDTLGSAPSMPATTMRTRARCSRSCSLSRRCRPATPTS